MLAGELGALHLVSAAEGLAGQAGKRFKAREPLLPGCGRVVRFFEGSAAGAEARIGAVGADGSARGAVAGGQEMSAYAFVALPRGVRRELEYL